MFCGLKPYYNLSFLSLITQCPLYQKNAKSDFNEKLLTLSQISTSATGLRLCRDPAHCKDSIILFYLQK